jgi:hypothetical protein
VDERRNFTRSGGCLLALTVVAGAVVGTIFGQPSIGFLAGSLVGLILVLVVFVIDRSRS